MSREGLKKKRFKTSKDVEVKRVTKPAGRPNRFKYQTTEDPALILELRIKGITLATLKGTLADDGSNAYTIVYYPIKAVAVATGRKPQMIQQWAEEGKFIAAQRISGRPVYVEQDVDRLLRTGDFFEQSINDPGHIGDIGDLSSREKSHSPTYAEELAVAAGKTDEARDRTPAKRGGKSEVPDPLPIL